MSLSLATRRDRLLAIRSRIDAGGGGALWLLDGDMAPSPESAPANAPLATVALPEVSFTMHESEAEMTLEATGHAAMSGQPTWARYVNAAGVGVWDRTAGPPGSGAQVIVTDMQDPPTSQIWTGGEIHVSHVVQEV